MLRIRARGGCRNSTTPTNQEENRLRLLKQELTSELMEHFQDKKTKDLKTYVQKYLSRELRRDAAARRTYWWTRFDHETRNLEMSDDLLQFCMSAIIRDTQKSASKKIPESALEQFIHELNTLRDK